MSRGWVEHLRDGRRWRRWALIWAPGALVKAKPGAGMVAHRFVVPQKFRDRGYRTVRVMPLKGDGRFSVGHLKLHKY